MVENMHVEKKPTPKQKKTNPPPNLPTPACLQQLIPPLFLKRNDFFRPALFKKVFSTPRLKPFCPPFNFEKEKICFV